jgi:hypothetical protein
MLAPTVVVEGEVSVGEAKHTDVTIMANNKVMTENIGFILKFLI